MIVVDGTHSNLKIANFQNLEEILVKIVEEENLQERLITDVLVNDQPFSELYPHQAEDIEVDEINSIELKTVHIDEMALNIAGELHKVVKLMNHGAKRVASLFRKADDGEALEYYQDLLDVTRDFLSMVGVLRNDFNIRADGGFDTAMKQISDLFTEMVDVQENEDFILLADLLEFEFIPATEQWNEVIDNLLLVLKNNQES